MNNKEADYAAKVKKEYVVIGHVFEFAIVKDEMGNQYFLEDENRCMEEGTVCEGVGLKLVKDLPLHIGGN